MLRRRQVGLCLGEALQENTTKMTNKTVRYPLKTAISNRNLTRESHRIHVVGKMQSVANPSELPTDYIPNYSVENCDRLLTLGHFRKTDSSVDRKATDGHPTVQYLTEIPRHRKNIYINNTIMAI